MSAAVVQLLAVGQADRKIIDATRGASVFTSPFQAHTPFSMESIEIVGGQATFGNNYSVEVLRSADLIGAMHLQVTLPSVFAGSASAFSWARDFGHKMIETVDVTVGSLRIDLHYGAWLAIWAQLTVPAEKRACYGRMVGDSNMSRDPITKRLFGKINGDQVTNFALQATTVTTGTAGYAPGVMLYVPLQFWFNRVPGLALPLVGLQYHQVRLNFKFAALSALFGCLGSANTVNSQAISAGSGSTITGTKIQLFATQYNLGKPERTAIAGNSREYLIEQVQSSSAESITSASQSIRIQLSHPVKFLAWTARPAAAAGTEADTHDFQAYTAATTTAIQANAAANVVASCLSSDATWSTDVANDLHAAGDTSLCGQNPLVSVGLKFNSSERFVARDGTYFNLVQPYEHFPSCPTDAGIMVYSFALRPCDQQPTGSANFSRLDHVNMVVSPRFTSTPNLAFRYYAVNLNTFVVSSGLGGLLWAN